MDAVEKACKIIEPMLDPTREETIIAKRKGLAELALINGTFKAGKFCEVCGEHGHQQFECPRRDLDFRAAKIKCNICGDGGHPTRDCPLSRSGQASSASAVRVDTDFDAFLGSLPG